MGGGLDTSQDGLLQALIASQGGASQPQPSLAPMVSSLPPQGGPPDQTPQGAPPAAPPSSGGPPPTSGASADPFRPDVWDILHGVLAGQSVGQATQVARGFKIDQARQQLTMASMQRTQAWLATQPAAIQAAYMASPQEFGKAVATNLAQTLVPGGETAHSGIGGKDYTAPLTGLDAPSGKGYAVDGQGHLSVSTNAAGGDFSASPAGVISSGRTGDVSKTFSIPQITTPEQSIRPFLTGVNSAGGAGGPPPDVPVLGQQPPSAATGGPGGPPPGAPLKGGGVVGGGAPGLAPGASAAPVDPSAPRGIRNGNPVNVRALPRGQNWRGQTGTDSAGYATFASPADGFRAAMRNLNSYGKNDGVSTIAGAISRWAPQEAGNNTAAYTAHVAQAMGTDPNARIDLTDPHVQASMVDAMAGFENGPAAYQAWKTANGASPGPGGQPPQQPAAAQAPGAPNFGSVGPPLVQGKTLAPPVYNPKTETWQQTDFSGNVKDVASNPMGASGQLKYASDFMATPQYKDYDQLSRFHDTAMGALNRQGGPSDLQVLDMAIKSNNPTLGARPNQVDQAISEIGPLGKYAGQIRALVNNGQKLSPEARQAFVNVIDDARASSWKSLQPLLAKADRDAARFGLTRQDLIPGVNGPEGAAGPSSGFGPSKPQVPQGSKAPPVQLAPDRATATAQYASIPSGAQYRAPDGSIRTKK